MIGHINHWRLLRGTGNLHALHYINSGLVHDVLVVLVVIVESARGQRSKHLDPVAFLQSLKMVIILVDLRYYKNNSSRE